MTLNQIDHTTRRDLTKQLRELERVREGDGNDAHIDVLELCLDLALQLLDVHDVYIVPFEDEVTE